MISHLSSPTGLGWLLGSKWMSGPLRIGPGSEIVPSIPWMSCARYYLVTVSLIELEVGPAPVLECVVGVEAVACDQPVVLLPLGPAIVHSGREGYHR